MDEFTSKVYIRTDNNQRVLRCEGGFSIDNIENIEDWILIDEGSGERYDHCQSQYFENGLYDETGIPRYKWDGAQVQLRTAEELDADRAALPQPAVTEPDVTNTELASAIKEGVESV